MKQGEIWLVNLNQSRERGAEGFRPVVILSGNLLNRYLSVVIAAPLTTRIKKYKGHPILEPDKTNGLEAESELLVFQIRSISKERFEKKLGKIEESVLLQVIKTLNEILKY